MMNGKSPPKVSVRFAGKHIFHIERVISGGIVGIDYVIFELACPIRVFTHKVPISCTSLRCSVTFNKRDDFFRDFRNIQDL